MITLCMDTSSKFLVLAMIKDHKILAEVQKDCWKRQSEEIFPALEKLLENAGLKPHDIDQIVVTKGPGSYTGVRIAMTIAKVFCAMGDKPLATLSTLQLYAGDLAHARVILDARGHRVYTAVYAHGSCVEEASVCPIEMIMEKTDERTTIVGDGHLIKRPDFIPNLAENFLILEKQWQFSRNVHMENPIYLKNSDSYMTGVR